MKILLNIFVFVVAVSVGLCSQAATIETYYFNHSNGLDDVDPGGGEYYGEVLLEVTAPNTIQITVTPFLSLEPLSSQPKPVSPSLEDDSNYGIQTFGMGIALTQDESEFTDRYDINLPDGWSYKTNKNMSEFGEFDFKFSGTGSTRQDPLVVEIKPKSGADISGFEFNDVKEFIEPNPDGYYFVAHIAGFAIKPVYIKDECRRIIDSAWFASDYLVPEPATGAIMVVGLCLLLRRRKR